MFKTQFEIIFYLIAWCDVLVIMSPEPNYTLSIVFHFRNLGSVAFRTPNHLLRQTLVWCAALENHFHTNPDIKNALILRVRGLEKN